MGTDKKVPGCSCASSRDERSREHLFAATRIEWGQSPREHTGLVASPAAGRRPLCPQPILGRDRLSLRHIAGHARPPTCQSLFSGSAAGTCGAGVNPGPIPPSALDPQPQALGNEARPADAGGLGVLIHLFKQCRLDRHQHDPGLGVRSLRRPAALDLLPCPPGGLPSACLAYATRQSS